MLNKLSNGSTLNFRNVLIKVAHYILKYFLKSAENYLILIDITIDKKYLNQIGRKCASLYEKLHFRKFDSVNTNKSSRRIRARDLQFRSQIL